SCARVCVPLGPSKTYSLETSSQGKSRRSRAISSCKRVSSFSLLSSCLRRCSQCSGLTTSWLRRLLLGVVSDMFASLEIGFQLKLWLRDRRSVTALHRGVVRI